jgi:acylphosphatase
MVKHYNITVRGKVQGVFFRAGALAEAKRLGIAGFAQNLSSGEVYIEAEGLEDPLSHFLEWCSKGPEKAEVATIQVEENGPVSYTGFEIRH